jgi:hypothetical protein
MKKLYFLLVTILFLPSVSQAQFWKLRRFEASAGFGTAHLQGDVGGFSHGENMLGLKDLSIKQTRYNLNLSGRYRILNDFSVRLNFNKGKYHSSDERGSNIGRGFESTTGFYEISAIAEFYFLKNRMENSFLSQRGRRMPFNSITALLDGYVFTGFGIVSYNVKPNELLSPQTSAIKGTDPIIPIGVGVSLNYSPAINFGAELGGRYVFSDNLDGYTSIYSERNDSYFFLNINATYKFRTGARNRRSF